MCCHVVFELFGHIISKGLYLFLTDDQYGHYLVYLYAEALSKTIRPALEIDGEFCSEKGCDQALRFLNVQYPRDGAYVNAKADQRSFVDLCKYWMIKRGYQTSTGLSKKSDHHD